MRHGYDSLWAWFGLSRAAWLTLPRSLMHEMPDEWQQKMADLLKEWDAAWDSHDMPSPNVVGRAMSGKMVKWPSWILNYRHPDKAAIDSLRAKP